MKKSKVLVLALMLALLVGVVFATTVSAFMYANSASGEKLASDSWISAPAKTLVKCQGGDCDHTGCDYVYSFAVVGDTQNLNYIDAQNYNAAKKDNSSLTYADYTSAHMRTLYNWILENKDSKNIQYVMGLGDITQSFNTSQTYYKDEWPLAKEALALLDGKLGYSLVRGNHDISSGMNAQFGVGTAYYNTLTALAATTDAEGRPMAAFRDASKVEDSYRKIVTSNGDKYIIYTLEYYPTEETVAWLNETLSANSDYDAIITLHSFLNRDATFVNEFETTTPAEDAVNTNWSQTATGGHVEPKDLWERALSKHENVKFVFSGHVDVEDVIVNQLKGDNGNTVTCMLIDCQTIDSKIEPAGVVTMIYVNANGTVVNVEHISTVRDAAGKAAYLKQQNQFALTVDYGTAWTETKYGNAPSAEYESKVFNVFLDDDSDMDSANFYYGGYNTWEETLSAIHAWNGIGGVGARAMKSYHIVMTDDYTYSNGIAPKYSGQNPGKINLDLNGKTLTLSGNGVLVPLYTYRTDSVATFKVHSGNFKMEGTSMIAVLQAAMADLGGVLQLDLEDLNVTYNGSKYPVVGTYSGVDGTKATTTVNVTNCNFDVTGAAADVAVFALQDTHDNNDTTLNIIGGSFVGSTSASTTLYTLNGGSDSAYLIKDANGNYPTVTLNENTAPTGIFRDNEGNLLNFVTESTAAPYLFTAQVAAVEETPYGLIPTDTHPKETYPFVLFQNGEIVAAYATWKDFCDNIYAVDTSESKNTVLYVRDTLTVTASANQLRNVRYLTVDLGGNTITSQCILFNFAAEKNYSFTTNITVTNGTLAASKNYAPLVAFNSSNTDANVDPRFNITFNGVTLTATSEFKGRILAECFKDGTYGTKSTITLNDCTIDAPAGVTNLFLLQEAAKTDGAERENKQDVAVYINGGKLIATKHFTLGTFSAERESGKGSPDTLTFGKGSDGKDFYIQVPNTVAQTKTGIVTTAGTLYPIETLDDGTNSIYYMESIVTEYGTIGTSYLSRVDYPFLLFKDGAVVHAAKNWYTLINTDIPGNTNLQSGATLLIRRDYNTDDAGKSSQNLYYVKDLVIDLDGHTLTRGGNHLFQAMEKHTSARRIVITVKNGTLVSKGAPVISFNDHGDSTVVSGYDFKFINVTFDLSAGKNLANAYTNGDEGMKNTVTLDNCTIDFGSYAKAITIFALTESSGNKQDISVVINGGTIKANSFANVTLATLSAERESGKGSPDSLKFGAYNGNYVKFVAKTGEAAPTYDCETVNGAKLEFANVSTDKNAIYQLGENVTTASGLVIPFTYTDSDKYPVIVFKNGTVVATETTVAAAYTKALAEVQGSASDVVVILLRADFTEKLTASYSNAELIKGTLVLDLDGHTYTTSGKAFFQFNAKNVNNNPKIVVRNGSLNTVRLIAFANQTTAKCQQYDILFKNVTLGLTKGHWADMISTNATASSAGYYAFANLTFEYCVFDLVTNQSGTSYRLMDLANDSDNHAVNVVFKGGEFILGDVTLTLASIKSGYSDNTHFVAGGNDSDTVKFEKGVTGYTVFTLAPGTTAPSNVYDSTELVFIKASDDADAVTYTLMKKVEFKPQSSITLSNALVYNVYVPVDAALKSFVLDGVSYTDIAALTNIVTINGESYYLVSIELPSAEAARDIVLVATITVDGTDYNGKWTMSVPKYATKVLTNDKATEVEKTLVKDTLAYVQAAYNYFTTFNTAEEIARVNALIDSILVIGGDYDGTPVSSGVTNTVAPVTGVTLNLDAKPSIRFYVTDTTLSFYANGRKLDTVSGTDANGTYVELAVNAYALCETITYGEGGSYHISNFLENAAGTDYENLVACFIKYTESAAAYRNSVIG